MNARKISTLLSILAVTISSTFTTSCKKTLEDPTDAVTLNMLDESNGKTLLGVSKVYINKSNNFYSSSSMIADAGTSSGVGASVAPKLSNLVSEAAVIPGHLYQIFDYPAVRDFPSGTRAAQVGAGYYQTFVVSPITTNNGTTGAVVKYILMYPDKQDLPEWDYQLGTMTYSGDQLDIAVPRDAECYFTGDDEYFNVTVVGGRLVVRLLAYPSKIHGPYGDYRIYIRQGSVFSSVKIQVG